MLSKIINGCRYWGQLLLLPIYWLSFFMPRNKNIWLFGSTFGRRFADNPKYFFLYMNQYHKEIRSVWISHNKEIVSELNQKGYEAYYYHSLKGIWMALRGKIYIFDNYSKDINFWQSGGAKKVNLWHGVGNKCINYDNIHDKVRHPKNLWERFKYFPRRLSDEKPSHYILATSPVMCEIFARAFQVPKNHVLEAGYPRNDYLLGDTIQNLLSLEEKKVLEYIKNWKKKGKIIMYMPTFRDSEEQFFDTVDLNVFNHFLEDNGLLFATKLHPKSKLKNTFTKITYSNIFNLDADMDPYIILKETDVLVTDYSSIYSDFMLLDRPVVAFWYDYDSYCKDTREAYFDFEEYMPEERARTMDELIHSLKKVLLNDLHRFERKKSCDLLFCKCNVDGGEQLYQLLNKIILKK